MSELTHFAHIAPVLSITYKVSVFYKYYSLAISDNPYKIVPFAISFIMESHILHKFYNKF